MGEGAGLMLVQPNQSDILSAPTSTSQSIGDSFFRTVADTASSNLMGKISMADNSCYSDGKALSQLVSGGFGSPTFSTASGEICFDSQSNNNGNHQDAANSLNHEHKSTTNGQSGEENGRPPAAKYRSMVPSRISMPPQSAPFTIPSGFSLSPLLESPVLIGGVADPSPTTGTFSFPFKRGGKDDKNTKDSDAQPNDNFMFKPDPLASKNEPLSVNDSDMYGFVSQNGQGSVTSTQLSSAPLTSVSSFEPVTCPPLNTVKTEALLELPSSVPETPERVAVSQVTNVYNTPIFRERSTDGYNWKKYGQKQLKGSEYPRSYYKCTHPGCPVKKQVECSHEGEITEIMYKGEHNHPKPQTTRRASRMLSHSLERPQIHENLSEVAAAGRLEPDRCSAELSSSSLVVPHGGLAVTPDRSFGSLSDEDGEACRVVDDDEEEDDLDSKRRRTEDSQDMLLAPIRTVREARVVVQTTSEVDILDDGYRWRKYGQKVVKGNLYPRSYYKCTNVGCIVRKHVERSSTDPKSVITTYEGKHNHNVPAARGSSAQDSCASAADTGINAAPMLEASSNVSVSNVNTMSRSMLLEQQAASNGFTMMNHMQMFPGMHSNLQFPLNIMNSNYPAMRQFASAELNGQGIGLTLPQQFYQPGLSSSYIDEKPFSRQ